MIAKLNRLANAIQRLRLPALYAASISMGSIMILVFFFDSYGENRFIIPSFIVLLWAVTTYAFIVTFRSVPENTANRLGFFNRLKYRISRTWYWFIGLLFLGTTLAVLLLTFRMASIWAIQNGG